MTVTVPRASEVDAYVDAFRDFVVSAPTAFHAAEQLAAAFGERGFARLAESEPWECVPGGKYVVVRDGSVIAWVMPTAPTAVTPWRILGAHTDSPSLRVKDLFGQRDAEGWAQIPVEVYGGPILSSWFDRDLEFAGRLVTGDGRILLSRSGPVARVPHLAVHLDRSVNDSFSPDREAHLQPIVGTAGSEVGLREHSRMRRGSSRRRSSPVTSSPSTPSLPSAWVWATTCWPRHGWTTSCPPLPRQAHW